jgi:phosphoglycerate dehydrogenase-like enzyme
VTDHGTWARVAILDSVVEDSVEREASGEGVEVRSFACRREEDLPSGAGDLADLDAVIVRSGVRLTAATLDRLRGCRFIIRAGVGFDNVDVAHAGALGIPVSNVPDYGTNEVADHSIALLLALWRRIVPLNEGVRADPVRGWQYDAAGPVRRLTGAPLGVVGLGRIGTAVASRGKALGMRVVFHDPYVPDGYDKAHQIERASSLGAMVASCDALSIHAPLTPETHHLVDAALLAQAKPGLTLINGGRGRIVSLDAVYDALRDGRLAAFGTDVLESEPPDPAHPLVAAYSRREPWLDGRMIVTPHAAFYSVEGLHELRVKAAEQVVRVLRGESPRNCVNAGYLTSRRLSR